MENELIAHRGKRVLAFVIDWLILGFLTLFFAIFYVVWIAMEQGFTTTLPLFEELTSRQAITFFLFFYFPDIFYFTLFHSSKWRATPGKMLVGLQVCHETGRKITVLESFGRTLVTLISPWIFYLGHFLAFFNQKAKALHDFALSTIVVERP